MRIVPGYEKKQRGCEWCLHKSIARSGRDIRTGCPFDECPYRVLDKYKTYEEFMASEDSKILVNEFFTSVAGCYELAKQAQSPKKIYSDGDHRLHL
jgi:hypothetical protein